MAMVTVEFDGKSFVPDRPINLPVGTRGTVAITDAPSATALPEAVDANDWQQILSQIRTTEPEQETLEETMRQIRMRP